VSGRLLWRWSVRDADVAFRSFGCDFFASSHDDGSSGAGQKCYKRTSEILFDSVGRSGAVMMVLDPQFLVLRLMQAGHGLRFGMEGHRLHQFIMHNLADPTRQPSSPDPVASIRSDSILTSMTAIPSTRTTRLIWGAVGIRYIGGHTGAFNGKVSRTIVEFTNALRRRYQPRLHLSQETRVNSLFFTNCQSASCSLRLLTISHK
jgi:hypothetical protein